MPSGFGLLPVSIVLSLSGWNIEKNMYVRVFPKCHGSTNLCALQVQRLRALSITPRMASRRSLTINLGCFGVHTPCPSEKICSSMLESAETSMLIHLFASSLVKNGRNSAHRPANKMLWNESFTTSMFIYPTHQWPGARKEKNWNPRANILSLPGWPHFVQICCRDLSEVFVQSLECNRERVLWLLQHNSTAPEHVRRLEDVS